MQDRNKQQCRSIVVIPTIRQVAHPVCGMDQGLRPLEAISSISGVPLFLGTDHQQGACFTAAPVVSWQEGPSFEGSPCATLSAEPSFCPFPEQLPLQG